MDVYNVLGYLIIGAFLGAVGQGARAVLGIKKKYQDTPKCTDFIEGVIKPRAHK